MADENRIVNGSYKGVDVSIESSTLNGGTKVSIKEFPNRDTETIETLGKIPRRFSLGIVVNDKPNAEYFAYRKRLLAALENAQPGELIHPLYGRVDNVICIDYSINERLSEFGSATLDANFRVSENTGIPTQSGNVLTQIVRQNTNVIGQVEQDIIDDYLVTLGFPGNFSDAFEKVSSFISTARSAVQLQGQNNTLLNEFNALLDSFESNLNSLLLQPSGLATSMSGVFTEMGNLFDDPVATQNVFKAFDGFGADDTEIQLNTAGRIQRQQNRDTINSAIGSASLSNTYLAASQIEYETVRDIDAENQRLENQYLDVRMSQSSETTKSLITEMRITVLEALQESRAQANNITTIETNETSARLLAFDLYGQDTLGQNLANLNGIKEVSFVRGQVEVFTDET